MVVNCVRVNEEVPDRKARLDIVSDSAEHAQMSIRYQARLSRNDSFGELARKIAQAIRPFQIISSRESTIHAYDSVVVVGVAGSFGGA